MSAVTVEQAGVAEPVTARRRRPVADVLASASDRLRGMDVRNTWQVAAGAVLLPLGVVIILLSWYGSAHTPYVQQQIPYLVSGSFVGLGMMVVGGLLFWAHWLYRIYDQADLHHAERMARQEELFQRLIDAVSTADGPRRAARTQPVSEAGALDLVATANGTNVHRADCPIVARHPDGLRRVAADEAESRPACRICLPTT
ncbi:MAG TPA: hypothetical protein VFA11_18685 [Acidimicrobiales bacterium]|nr:hypothetical protein [Acidimicrobiales bacterium]